MGVPSCTCDIDPTSEDCVIVHPTMVSPWDIVGATPLFPPYDSPAVVPAVDMIADATPAS